MTEQTERITFTSAEGFPLVADCWGDPNRDPVLFMHGGGQTRHSWGGAARRLAMRGWHTITVDGRGHGESGWSKEGNYDLDDYVADFCCILEQIGRKTAVVGASLGGRTGLVGIGEGLEASSRALILVDIAPRTEKEGVARIRQFMRANLDGFASVEDAADAVAVYRQHRSRPKDIEGLKKNLRYKEDGRWYWHWDPKFLNRQDWADSGRRNRLHNAAQNLGLPTLLIRGGGSDVVSPEGVREFLDLVPHAAFVDVAGAGHMVAGDKNDVFTDAVEGFLTDSVDSAAA